MTKNFFINGEKRKSIQRLAKIESKDSSKQEYLTSIGLRD